MEIEVQVDETRSPCCCSSCYQGSCASQMSLLHAPETDFVKSQWQNGDCSKIFLLYRWCFAIWLTVTMGFSMEQFFFDGKWFIYFTNWGYILCTLVAIYSAILVSVYFLTAPKASCPCWMLRLYWVLHITSFVCATGLSFIYWIFIYPFSNFKLPEGVHSIEIIRMYRYFFVGPDSHSCLAFFHNINSHAINAVLMILDQMVVAFPTRIMHCIYPGVIVISYLLFTLIYYFVGGENVIGMPYIYKILNWGEHPLDATIVACAGILLTFPMCLLGYFIYKLRICLHSKKCPS